MQQRLDRISALINEGYTLKRGRGFDIQLHNSAGVRRNPLNPWKSPGGFFLDSLLFPKRRLLSNSRMVIFLLDCNSVFGQRRSFKHHG